MVPVAVDLWKLNLEGSHLNGLGKAGYRGFIHVSNGFKILLWW